MEDKTEFQKFEGWRCRCSIQPIDKHFQRITTNTPDPDPKNSASIFIGGVYIGKCKPTTYQEFEICKN